MGGAAAKPVFDITPFTMLDYPNHLACIVWFAGCNMRCDYCYNTHIVNGCGTKSADDLLAFLRSRIGRLEGVVLSGGECTLYANLADLCAMIKELGFKVKVDTNGSNPAVLTELIRRRAVDYIALDFKAPRRQFNMITHAEKYDQLIDSLCMLISANIPFEVRTTIHADQLDHNAINEIISVLSDHGYTGSYFLQNYLHTDQTLGNCAEPHARFDSSRLSSKINIEFRNF